MALDPNRWTLKTQEAFNAAVDRARAANNPEVTPDHAVRACRAALKMRAELADFNKRWEPRLGEATGISIGINSGPAQVGNIGSLRKFKYGALGHTVNLASRVQGANKHLRTSLLITRATQSKARSASPPRRVPPGRP